MPLALQDWGSKPNDGNMRDSLEEGSSNNSQLLINQSLTTNSSETANSYGDGNLEPLVINDRDLEGTGNSRENKSRNNSENQTSVFKEKDNTEVRTRSGRLVKQNRLGDCLYY